MWSTRQGGRASSISSSSPAATRRVDRGPFRHRLRAQRRLLRAAARRRSSRPSRGTCPKAGQTSFTRQQAPLGLGHAVWCAREIVGDEPFAVLLPDMLSRGSMEQMLEAYEKHGGNIIAVEEVPGGPDPPVRDRLGRRGIRQDLRDHRDGREAAAGHRALELHHLRPLHPAARDLRPPRRPRRRAPAARSSSPTP